MDEDLVVYDPRSGQGHVLNATAARVWRLLDGSRTTGIVAETLAASYGLPDQQAFNDVRKLVQNLHRAGLVVD
jgi:PqqD family protein of HPr-rel-A system